MLKNMTMSETNTNQNVEAGESLLLQASGCVRRGDDASAEKLIQIALATQSTLKDGYAQLGGICREQKQWERARYWMERDYAAGQMSQGWQLRYAEVLAELGQLAEAEEIVATAYQQDSDATDGYARLGGVFMRRKEWECARQWIKRDYATGRISPVWMLHYAVVFAELWQLAEAEEIVATAYQKDHDATDGYARLGAVFMRRKEWECARQWMERDVKAKRISSAWNVHYAHLLGLLGEIEQAEKVIDDVMAEITAGDIPVKVFFQACQTLLFLKPCRNIFAVQENGLAHYPGLSGDDLVTKAGIELAALINRRQILNSNRVTQKMVSEYYEDDIHDDLKVSWARVVQDYDCALAAGANMEENNALQQMILAQLFHGQELRQAGNQDGSAKALRKCLQCVTPALTPETSNPIAEAIHAFQSGEKSKQDSTDQIMNALANEKYLLSSRQWLTLNDILVWHRFFRCGYRAWENSIQQAYIEADTTKKDVRSQQHAFRAAMIFSDYDRAAHYLKFLHDSDAKAYLDLHHGRIEEAQAYWQSRFDDSYRSFHPRIRGKTVAIVGPAPTGELCGEEIDQHQIVIRTCYSGKTMHPDEFGRRTTASNYPHWLLYEWQMGANLAYLHDLEWYMLPAAPLVAPIIRDIKKGKVLMWNSNSNIYWKGPNSVPHILLTLLKHAPSQMKIFKTNFYVSPHLYSRDYISAGSASPTTDALRRTTTWDHDFICQLAFVRNLWNVGAVDADNACRQMLQMTNEQYMEAMDCAHGG